MLQLLTAVPWWDCLQWLTQVRQPGWYRYLQHLNWEISIPGAAQGVQRSCVSLSSQFLIQLKLLHTSWWAVRCWVGSVSPLLSPSLFSASQGEIYSSPGEEVHGGPWLLGQRPHTHDADEAPTKQWKVHVCVGMGFWRLGSCSPCQLAHVFSQGQAMPLWSAFSPFCTDRCLMLRWKLWKAKFLHTCKAVPGQSWANLSQF